MIALADNLSAHFQELEDTLTQVDLSEIEASAWALLIEIEGLDRGLGVLPDTGPDFTNCITHHELAESAQRRIAALDAHLNRALSAHTALLAVFGALEDARAAGERADRLVREIDYILTLQQGHHHS